MTEFLNNSVARLIGSVVRHAWLWITGYAAALVVSAFAAASLLGVNTDSSQMLSPNLDFQQKMLAFNADYPGIKNAVVIVVRADTPDAADAATRLLVTNLSASKHLTNVFGPSVDPFFLKNGLLYQSVDELDANLAELNKSASLLASLRADPTLATFFRSLYTAEELASRADFDRGFLDQFYSDLTMTIAARLSGKAMPLSWAKATDKNAVNVSVSDDTPAGEVAPTINPTGGNEQVQRLIYATPVLNFAALQPAKDGLAAIRSAVDGLPQDIKTLVRVGVTGDPAMRFEELQSVSKGIGLSFALSFVLVGILILIALRSWSQVVLSFLALITALVLSTGFAALVFGTLNLVSVAFVVILVGLGVDYTIHTLAHLGDEAHPSADAAAIAVGHSIGGAMILSALTTVIAFVAFVPSDFTGMKQLGILGAAGVVIAFLVSVTFVPALISKVAWFQPKVKYNPVKVTPVKVTALPSRTARFFILTQRPLALVLILAGIVGTFYAGDVRFDADPIALRDPESPSMRTLALLQERADTVPYRLSLLRDSAEAAEEAANAVAKLETVESARTLMDLVPKEQQDKLDLIDQSAASMDTIVNGEGLDHATLPEGKSPLEALRDRLAAETGRPQAVKLAAVLDALAKAPDAARLAVEKDVFRFFPDLIDTIGMQVEAATVTLDTLPPFFKERFRGMNGDWRVDVVPREDMRDPAALQRFVDSVEAFDPAVVGTPLQISKAGAVVSRAMVTAVGIAGVAIVLITYLLLRSLYTVLAILLPLVLAGLLTIAASVAFDIAFNYANIIVLPLLIGLGVDSGIHVAMRRAGVASSTALFETSTPRAVLFSGLTTIAAFATLGVSEHQGTASMGIMLAIAVTVTLLCSIVLTSILMDMVDKLARQH
ncbi:MAG: MMPL family transporter [Rhizobiales bacterium]|nr:MMPL family transporter [Hyphomicrobiales bacterium]